jgi:hypothetical protein
MLILGIGVYDLATRRRLHPAYVAGAGLIFTGQITASLLDHNAAWTKVATSIIRSWPFA